MGAVKGTLELAGTSEFRPATAGATGSSGFAATLRQYTQAVHREAERTGFVADLLHARATRAGYALYLRNLLPVYEAMEGLLPAQAAPSARAFADLRLARGAALRRDLAALSGAAFDTLAVLPEADAYVVAVRGSGIGLVGHAYARILGDLSGGQIIKPLLARTLGLLPGQLCFYDFPGLDIAECKTSLRCALDTLDPDSRDASQVLAAAISAFRHTIAVSRAIAEIATPARPA